MSRTFKVIRKPRAMIEKQRLEKNLKRVLKIARFWRDAGTAMIRSDVEAAKRLRAWIADMEPRYNLHHHSTDELDEIVDMIDPTWREREEAALVVHANKISGHCPSCGSDATEIDGNHGFCRDCTFNWHVDNPDAALAIAVAIQAEMDDRDEYTDSGTDHAERQHHIEKEMREIGRR